jgi:hypothetical protein
MGGPMTCHWVRGSGLYSLGNRGQYAFQWFPWKMGQGPLGGFLQEHSLLKRPSCSHWKLVHRFGLCPRRTFQSAAIRASCQLSFLFSFFKSLFFFF